MSDEVDTLVAEYESKERFLADAYKQKLEDHQKHILLAAVDFDQKISLIEDQRRALKRDVAELQNSRDHLQRELDEIAEQARGRL